MAWTSVRAVARSVSAASLVLRVVRPVISAWIWLVRVALSAAASLVPACILDRAALRLARRRSISMLPFDLRLLSFWVCAAVAAAGVAVTALAAASGIAANRMAARVVRKRRCFIRL